MPPGCRSPRPPRTSFCRRPDLPADDHDCLEPDLPRAGMIPATFSVPSWPVSPVRPPGGSPRRRLREGGPGPSRAVRPPVRAGWARRGPSPSHGVLAGISGTRSRRPRFCWVHHVNRLCADGRMLEAVRCPLGRIGDRCHSRRPPAGILIGCRTGVARHRCRLRGTVVAVAARPGGNGGEDPYRITGISRIKRRQETERCPEVECDGGHAVRLAGQPSSGVDQGHPSTLRSEIRHDRSTRVTARCGITRCPGGAARSGDIARLGDTTWRSYKVEFGGTTRPASRREGGNTCRRPS